MERRALKLSTAVSFGLAAFAFLTAFWSRSDTVLLDGYYSILTSLCGLAALRVATLLRRPDNAQYPFGYAGFEPLLNFLRGGLVLGVTSFASLSALTTLSQGGHPVGSQVVALYALLTASACFYVASRVGRLGRKVDSPLLKVDSESWRVDGMISLGVFVAFVVASVSSQKVAPYYLNLIDPVMVLLLSLVSLPTPLKIVKTSVRQLVGAASGCEREARVLRKVRTELGSVPVAQIVPRAARLGRELYLNLYVILESDLKVAEMDAMRQRITSACRQVEPNSIVDVLFTRQHRWAAPETTVK